MTAEPSPNSSWPPPAVVIFDLDGVIVDSEIWWHEVRVAWARAIGRDWTHVDSAAVMGANSAGWARIMRQRLDLPVTDEPAILESIVEGVVARYVRDGAPSIVGAVEAVRAIARRLPVAVASSAHRAIIEVALAATGLDGDIGIVVSSDEVTRGKPAPDVYLETARRLGATPSGCLVVEDSINGVRAGRAAGMRVVLVPNASVPPATGAEAVADVVLPDLAELVRWLDRAVVSTRSRDASTASASPDRDA